MRNVLASDGRVIFAESLGVSNRGAATSRLVSFHLTVPASLSFFFLHSFHGFFFPGPFFSAFSFAKTTNGDKERERVKSDTKTRCLTDPKQRGCSSIKDPEVRLLSTNHLNVQISTFDLTRNTDK